MSGSREREELGGSSERSSAIFGNAEELTGEVLLQHIVNRFTNVLPWVLVVVLLASFSRALYGGWHPFFTVQVAFVTVVFLSIIFHRQLPPRWTATALITSLYFIGVLSLVSYGLVGTGGAIVLAGLNILCGTIYGKRIGLLCSALSAVLFVLIAVGALNGWWGILPKNIEYYLSSPASWTVVGVDMAVVSMVAILCIGAIQDRLRSAATMNRYESIFINSIFNAQRDLFLVFDPNNGKPLTWNRAFSTFFDLDDSEIEKRLVPAGWSDRFIFPGVDDVMSAIQRLVENRGESIETELINSEGRKVLFEFNGSVVELPDRRQVIAVMGRDLSERREAERALRERERHLRLISQSLPSVVWTSDHAGNMVYVSPNAADICGFSAEELKQEGMRLWIPRIHEDDRQKFKNAFVNMMVHKQAVDCQFRFLTKDERWIWLNERVAPTVGKDDEAAACGVFSDVTDFVNAQERSRQSEKLEVLGQLAGGIAHDFNNQLSAILGLADLLAIDVADDPILKKRVDEIVQCAGHAADLPNQLLTFSRRGTERRVPVDVHKIVEQTAAFLGRSFSRSIHIQTSLEASLSTVHSVASRLENALLNLCLNARDAMPHGGDLTVHTENRRISDSDTDRLSLVPGDYLCVSVADTGNGMPDEIKKRIFEPFFTTKPVGKGTGMGLPQVYGFVKGMRGEIEVRSEVGKGCTMSLFLPLARPVDEERQTGPKIGNKVMLVDDEDGVLQVVSSMLEDMGLSVVECRSAQEAVSEYRQRQGEVSLIILDMVLPDAGVETTFTALREINEDVPVLLVSAKSSDEQIRGILNRGACGYLPKPFGLPELKAKVEAAMGEQA